MTKSLHLMAVLLITILVSCAEKEEKKGTSFTLNGKTETESVVVVTKEQNILASKKIDLENKGIGPIKRLQLEAEIDQNMVTHGAELYKNKCASCHRTDKKFIGPPSVGILERRTPEWIMNKMLNPIEMMRKDVLSKELLKEFNYVVMPTQGLNEYDARAVLEYFRTLN